MVDPNIVKEWLQFAQTDMDAATHLWSTMRPMPLEIICYHCQQAAEKMLKGFLISKGQYMERKRELARENS